MQDVIKSETDRLTEQLKNGITALRSSEGYQKYLRVQARFPHYSARNCLLILSQMPEATQVAGYAVWRSLGRQVTAGEHGIKIIAPHTYKKSQEAHQVSDSFASASETASEEIHLYFRPTTVFDISQTFGNPLPTLLVEELKGTVDGFQQIRDALISVSPVPVHFDTITSGAKGYYSPSDQKIIVNAGMSDVQTIKTLAHEIGHASVHSPGSLGQKKTVAERETEAESIAYMVCSHYGISTDEYSFPYIAEWSSKMSDKELLTKITGIKGAAAELMDRTDAAIERRQSEQREKIAYKIPSGYVAASRVKAASGQLDGDISYRFCSSNYKEIASGTISLPPQISIQAAAEQVLINHGLDPQDKSEISFTQISESAERAHRDMVRRMR